MRKQLLLLFVLGTLRLHAQPTDSVRIISANWQSTRIGKGVVWQEHHFDSLFRSKQNINVVTLRNRRRRPSVRLASAGDSLKPTSWFGKRDKALVALNGTFFDVKNGGSVDLIKIDGQVIDTTRLSGKTMPEHQQAAIAIRRNRVRIVLGGNKPGWDRDLPEKNVMTTGPLLLQNGQPHVLLKNAFNDNRHPRTCLCIGPRRRLSLITVDGRNANAQGMNLHELTDLMRWLGCRDAINLDGGGSTTLWIDPAARPGLARPGAAEQSGNGVVNYPSDSKQWIHTGERPVSNAILIR